MENKFKPSDTLQRADIDTIIQVNNKAIELQTEISDQYEEIISTVESMSHTNHKILDEVREMNKEIKEINKLQFKIMLALGSGFVSLIIQVLYMLKK